MAVQCYQMHVSSRRGEERDFDRKNETWKGEKERRDERERESYLHQQPSCLPCLSQRGVEGEEGVEEEMTERYVKKTDRDTEREGGTYTNSRLGSLA